MQAYKCCCCCIYETYITNSQVFETIQNMLNNIGCNTTSGSPKNYDDKLRQVLSVLTPPCQGITGEEVYKAVESHLKKGLAIVNVSKTFVASSIRLPGAVTTITEA